jgi:hypothetical protein
MLAALIDRISASASVKAVRRILAVSDEIARAFASSSVPVIAGIRWSLMMAATGSPSRRRSASSPRSVRSTRYSIASSASSESSTRGSSSTRRTVSGASIDQAPRATGMRTVKVAPWPGGLVAWISPRCFLTIS